MKIVEPLPVRVAALLLGNFLREVVIKGFAESEKGLWFLEKEVVACLLQVIVVVVGNQSLETNFR